MFNPRELAQAHSAAGAVPTTVPLCVAFDGALVAGSVLLESLLRLVKLNPLHLFLALLWLSRGRSAFRAELQARVALDPATLPYNHQFILWLRSQRAAGRQLWLYTASRDVLAARVAAHLGLFEGILTSDSRLNRKGVGAPKTEVEVFEDGGFDYCGNDWPPAAIWEHARGLIVVNPSVRTLRYLHPRARVLRVFPRSANRLSAYISALRPHQWSKNALVAVPPLAAHLFDNMSTYVDTGLALFAFCLCASSAYVLNDLLDLESDRVHPRKSLRPLASGDLSAFSGIVLSVVLLSVALLASLFLPPVFLVALGGYYGLTLAYSLALKGLVLIDAVTLATLYTVRVIAGGAANGVSVSTWLLLFSIFLFLSLALVKRYAELDALRRRQLMRAAGREYTVEDLPLLQSLGTAAGYVSILVLALYINSPTVEALYRRPSVLWLLCLLLLYWISRVWITTQRGAMHDDPVVYALKDRTSLGVGLLAAGTIFFAI